MNAKQKLEVEAINRVAKKFLDLETLDTRSSDELDFSDQAVWSIKRALEAAYRAGQQNEHDHNLKLAANASRKANIKLNFD